MIDLSRIQKLILSKLMPSDGMRYSVLRPDGIDKDLYYYHLKFLIDKGYIEKEEKIYKLTKRGKSLVTNLTYEGDFNNVFKVGFFMFIEKEIDGEKQILMHQRKRQPYYDDYLPPSGTFKQGELIENAIERKLSEETGLDCEFTRFGMMRLIFSIGGKLVEDINLHLLFCNSPKGENLAKNDFGIFEFTNYTNAIDQQMENKTKIQSMIKVLKQLENGDLSPVYLEEVNNLTEL